MHLFIHVDLLAGAHTQIIVMEATPICTTIRTHTLTAIRLISEQMNIIIYNYNAFNAHTVCR